MLCWVEGNFGGSTLRISGVASKMLGGADLRSFFRHDYLHFIIASLFIDDYDVAWTHWRLRLHVVD